MKEIFTAVTMTVLAATSVLLHFDEGNGLAIHRQCRERLKRYLPSYDKDHLETAKLIPGIASAIERDRLKDN